MTVLLYLIGTSVGSVIAGIFMQMYQTTIEGIVGSFPASQSYNSIFITSILMSMVSIVLFTVINKRTSKAIDGSIINTLLVFYHYVLTVFCSMTKKQRKCKVILRAFQQLFPFLFLSSKTSFAAEKPLSAAGNPA
jgi:hypothetical protein